MSALESDDLGDRCGRRSTLFGYHGAAWRRRQSRKPRGLKCGVQRKGRHFIQDWDTVCRATVLVVVVACGTALAGPEGEQVVRGNVQVQRSGSQTQIRASHNSIINYRSFDIGSHESVRFVQPNAQSRVLNRIQSPSPTRIDGALQANGHVYLVNRSGVLFGPGSVINVGALYAASGTFRTAISFDSATGSLT